MVIYFPWEKYNSPLFVCFFVFCLICDAYLNGIFACNSIKFTLNHCLCSADHNSGLRIGSYFSIFSSLPFCSIRIWGVRGKNFAHLTLCFPWTVGSCYLIWANSKSAGTTDLVNLMDRKTCMDWYFCSSKFFSYLLCFRCDSYSQKRTRIKDNGFKPKEIRFRLDIR